MADVPAPGPRAAKIKPPALRTVVLADGVLRVFANVDAPLSATRAVDLAGAEFDAVAVRDATNGTESSALVVAPAFGGTLLIDRGGRPPAFLDAWAARLRAARDAARGRPH